MEEFPTHAESHPNNHKKLLIILLAPIVLFLPILIFFLVLFPEKNNETKTPLKTASISSSKSATPVSNLPAPTPPKKIQPPPAPKSTSAPPPSNHNINIVGNAAFVQQTKGALSLLKQKNPTGYNQVLAYINTIESVSAGSGMYVDTKTFKVGNQTAFPYPNNNNDSLSWYAGTIVHDSNHSKLYYQGQPYTGQNAEVACLQVQLTSLQKIGAASFMITYVQDIINDPESNPYWTQENRHW